MLDTPLGRLLEASVPEREAGISRLSWPERVNRSVALDFGFDFLSSRSFAGAIRHRQIAAVRTFGVACEPHLVYRQASHVDPQGGSYYLLTLQVTGVKRVEQGGRRARLEAGRFCVYDSERPLTLDVGPDYRSVNLRFPKAAMRARDIETFEDLLIEPLSVRDGIAPAVWGMLLGLDCQAESAGPRAFELSRHAVDLAAMLLSSGNAGETRTMRTDDTARITRVKSWIDAHLGEPGLTVERAAAANFVSVRTLHKLFAETGETAAAWIRNRRIDAARRMLEDAAEAASIAEIAARCGFASVSHFTQVFRAIVGATPSEYRAACRAASGPAPAA